MITPTGRIDVPARFRTQQDDIEETYWGRLAVMADESYEPLARLMALEEMVRGGRVPERLARDVLGMS
jgi:hypothetical protein